MIFFSSVPKRPSSPAWGLSAAIAKRGCLRSKMRVVWNAWKTVRPSVKGLMEWMAWARDLWVETRNTRSWWPIIAIVTWSGVKPQASARYSVSPGYRKPTWARRFLQTGPVTKAVLFWFRQIFTACWRLNSPVFVLLTGAVLGVYFSGRPKILIRCLSCVW